MIRDLLPFSYSDGEVQKIFSPPQIAPYKNMRKIKHYIVRSKLYPVEREVILGVKFVRALLLLAKLLASPLKTYKIYHTFDCNDKCLIYLLLDFDLAVSHVVINMQVTPPTILEVDGITIRVMLEKLRVGTWKMSNESLIIKVFSLRFGQLIKHRCQPKRSFTG